MFSTSGCQSTKCDQSSRTLHTPISPKSTKSRCSCEGNSVPLTSYNRLLLPAVSQKDHTSSLGVCETNVCFYKKKRIKRFRTCSKISATIVNSSNLQKSNSHCF